MKQLFIVDEENVGKRLDVFLSENIDKITRSQIKKSIGEGLTLVNNKPAKAGKITKLSEVIEFEEYETKMSVEPENLPIEIVYEDDDIAVINKKQGMTVHPAPGNYSGTLVNALLYHFDKISSIGEETRPGIVHRIDKDTSGLLMVAKNNVAHLDLASQIADRSCKRIYIALCEGIIKNPTGTIASPIGRDKKDPKKMAVTENGKSAITYYEVLEVFKNHTLVRFELFTGRTHQIRVHAKHIGHPIVGDLTYGFSKQKYKLDGQLLHAAQLELVHPKTKQHMIFESKLPPYFQKIVTALKKQCGKP